MLLTFKLQLPHLLQLLEGLELFLAVIFFVASFRKNDPKNMLVNWHICVPHSSLFFPEDLHVTTGDISDVKVSKKYWWKLQGTRERFPYKQLWLCPVNGWGDRAQYAPIACGRVGFTSQQASEIQSQPHLPPPELSNQLQEEQSTAKGPLWDHRSWLLNSVLEPASTKGCRSKIGKCWHFLYIYSFSFFLV